MLQVAIRARQVRCTLPTIFQMRFSTERLKLWNSEVIGCTLVTS
jgi:hypothetical protein